MLDWSGDGAQSAHSGAFTVRLNHVRPLSAGSADAWQPIDVTAEATYSPESIFFSNLVLGDGDTTLASRVVANPSSLTLQNLKLLHGKSVWLAGDAQIPLNVWAAWQNPGTASWWNFESPCKLDLKLDRLSVHDTLLLSGRQQLTAAGHLVIKNAAGTVPEGTLKAGDATLDFNGSQLGVAAANGDWNGLAWSASGAVTAPDVRTPALDLAVKLPSAPVSFGNGMDATAAMDLRATGQLATLAISGTAQLQSLRINRSPSLESLVGPGGAGLQGPPSPLALAGPPAWKLNVQVTGNAAVELARGSASRDRPAPERVPAAPADPSGIIAPTLEISGSLAHPAISGSIALKGFSMTEGPDQIAIAGGAFFLNPVDPAATSLVLRTSGVAGGDPFDGYIFGTLAQKHFTWSPRLTAILAGSATPSPIPAAAPSAQPLTLGTAVARQSASPLPASATP
jgi:hypothetical protein